MQSCAICKKEYKSLKLVGLHVVCHHKISTKEYYDTYIGKQEYCPVCGKPCKFLTIGDGYNATCGFRCGGIYYKARLKKSTIKYNSYLDKITEVAKKQWEEYRKKGVNLAEYYKYTISDDESRFTPFGVIDDGINDEESTNW